MATLNFKGKTAVWNHHLSVPYHVLEKDKKISLKGKDEDKNLIIEGDNLLALKSLLPKYQGKIKCIYIDPPYNTGNEGWVYNDNVNNPIIKTWIGETVGKEGEDMTRHDKWLCMMTPRLKLLRELLADDGIFCVSIDDNEVYTLRALLNEIFGIINFVAEIPRVTKKAGKSSDDLSKNHDYVLIYKKDKNKGFLNRLAHDDVGFKHKDEYFSERGLYKLNQTLDYNTLGYVNSLDYEISIGKHSFYPGGVSQKDFKKRKQENPQDEFRWRWSKSRFDFGQKNGFVVVKEGKKGKRIYTKTYQFAGIDKNDEGYFVDYQDRDKALSTLDLIANIYSNDNAKKDLRKVFGKTYFDYPKPVSLIKELILRTTNKDSIILDSFSGSGTTAQAVIEANFADKGNRNFLLIQIPEKLQKNSTAKKDGYNSVQEITRDRVKKVITRDGLDVGFTYHKLGPSIDGKKLIEGKNMPSWETLAKYVYNLATGKAIDNVSLVKSTWQIKGTDVYLIYKDSKEGLKNLAITRDWLESIKNKEGKKIVYAPACFLDKEILDEYNISFVQIPYNLFTRT